MTFIEKRRSPRVPVSMNVQESEIFKTLGFGYARDISERGLAVDAEALVDEESVPNVGTELRMRFKLPKSHFVITARGKVVRVDRETKAPRIALEFTELANEFRTEIRNFVKSTQPI
ncbi:MAG: PilZ domain-containing protein [Pseudomonadota bacterium]